jgi:hypothetical protein
MSVRRFGNKGIIPPNPTWVEIPRSDGDASRWPTNTTKIVDGDGQINWMRPADIDEGLCIKWRIELGPRIAAILGLPCKYLDNIVH